MNQPVETAGPASAAVGAAAHRSWVRRAAPLWSALLCLLVSAAMTWWTGVPAPFIMDEPSYLLAADTFAHGRVTNPTHPMWRHFQTFHVLQQPSYMSKYPPAEGVMLAIGEVVGGEPIVGAWLATALAAGAVTWALRTWLPWRWAVVATAVVIFHPLFTLVWGQSYWGGNVQMLGGALVTGAFRWLWRRPSVSAAIAATAGVIVLGFSRPYEGGLFTLMLLVPLAGRYVRRGWAAGRVPWRRVALTCLPCLAVAAAAQGYYDYRVTGHVLQLPYMAYERQYDPVPLFVWQGPNDEVRRWDPPTMREMYTNDFWVYQRRRSADGFWHDLAFKAHWVYADYIGSWKPVLLVPAAGLLLVAWRRRWVRAALAVTLGLFAIVLLSNATMGHYVAPAAALFVYLVASGLRAIAGVHVRGRAVGRWVAGATLAVYVGTFFMWAARAPGRVEGHWQTERVAILRALEERPGDHLVLVRYEPPFTPSREWVYNSADIDAQRVVWAHNLGPDLDRQLLAYYPHRQAWLLTVAPGEKRVEPYHPPPATAPAQ